MAKGFVEKNYEILLIGGSAGSLDAILRILPALEAVTSLAMVLIVHRRGGESMLTGLLDSKTNWTVKEAEEKEQIRAGTFYIAPADYHLLIEHDKTFSLDYSEKINYSRPAIDVTFETAAEAYGSGVIGLLLSGANTDGTAGLQTIKKAGGYVMVQDPNEAIVPFMPKYAIEHSEVDEIVSIANIAASIQRLLHP